MKQAFTETSPLPPVRSQHEIRNTEHGIRTLHSALRTPHSQGGVALVITLILLSVITFMAVTFLVVSRTEKGAVATGTDQTIATLAAETAVERAKSDLMSRIIAFTNEFEFDLEVSRNYVNQSGFDATLALQNPTNVNYDVTTLGVALTPAQQLRNIANLLYDPRPPVFIGTNADFRFYLDLNRNGRFDTNGLQPVISPDPAKPYYDTNGNTMAAIIPGNTLSNVFVGDPEWIGVLEKPAYPPSLLNPPGIQPSFAVGYPHSATNKFISRYAYIVVPSGKTLDLNSVHNHAKQLVVPPKFDGFMRNQGVGPWEINLAAFLVDLNTNMWPFPVSNTNGIAYSYNTNLAQPSPGVAFEDALALIRFRYPINDYRNLSSVSGLFGNPGANAFAKDGIDGYSAGPLMTGLWWPVSPLPDQDATRTGKGWSGADNPDHFFTTQDLFDKSKTAIGVAGNTFTDRLKAGGNLPSSYDRYTFYRMLAQMGTDSDQDSAAAPVGKLNINYKNVDNNGTIIPNLATNFNSWTPLQFFTNVADRLLRAQFTNVISATNIPVYVSNTFVYSPSVQRVLQLAANIYDATTNSMYASAPSHPFPTVFRPIFSRPNGTNVYINGFAEVTDMNSLLAGGKLVDLNSQTVVANLKLNGDLVFGVPLIVSARKGLPNFNEFTMENVFQISRKMFVHRATASPPSGFTTNVMYTLSISNGMGVVAWNSYRSNYDRQVDIYATNYLSMVLTNDAGLNYPLLTPIGNATNITIWPGYTGANPTRDFSFLVPMATNLTFLPDAIYKYGPPGYFVTNNLTTLSEPGMGFPMPHWGLAITNRLQFMMVDHVTGRLMDYVQLNGMDTTRDVSAEIATTGTSAKPYDALWNTNRNNPFEGGNYQLNISMGNPQTVVDQEDWNNYGLGQLQNPSKRQQVDRFRVFLGLPPYWYPNTTDTAGLDMQVPFTPTRRVTQILSWQANDPLVHYTSADLADLARGNGVKVPKLTDPIQTLALATNVSLLTRYNPWGGNPTKDVSSDPTASNLALKDPLIRRSDYWEFPTNKFPNIGWLGRVHRGTPWQTVYLKASDIATSDLNTWKKWCGNGNDSQARQLAPVTDRLLLDVFTTAFNDNAARGQLSVNQTNLAAWSAVFSSVIALQGTNNGTKFAPATNFPYVVVDPVGNTGPSAPLMQIMAGINSARRTNFNGAFQHLGDVLAAPELTEKSPFLNLTNTLPNADPQWGISDAVYERLPQQVLGLLKVDHTPRFVVYGYGQALKPAPHSVLTSGQFFGMVTNYQITAEVAVRAVVRIDGAPINGGSGTPHAVIESYNVLGPDQ